MAFFKDICHVEDRDSPGNVLRWGEVMRQPQKYALKVWRTSRAFNVFRNLHQLKLEEIAKQVMGKKWKPFAQDCVPNIMDYGITALMEDVRDKMFLRTGNVIYNLHDGPCRFWEGKGRQVGFSYKQQQIQMWRASTVGPRHFLVVSHDEDTSELIFSFSKTTFDYWPENLRWMRPATVSDARRKYVFDNGSTISVRTAGGTRIIGRKVDGVHSSESSHYEDPDAFVHALSGLPIHCHLHVESTADGPKGFYYEVGNEAITIERKIAMHDRRLPITTEWVEIFTPWLDDPDYKIPPTVYEIEHYENTLSDYEKTLMAADKRFDWARVKWRRYKLEHDTKRHPTLSAEQFWMQEYPATKLEMFQHSGSAVFSGERLRELDAEAMNRPPLFNFRFDGKGSPALVKDPLGANLHLWELPEERRQYIIAADIALGLANKDRSWVSVWKRIDDQHIEQVGEWLGWIGPRWLADIITFLCLWYNNAFLIPEVNAAGQGPVDTITIDNGYSNVYIHRPMGLVGGFLADSSVRYGFITTGKSKQTIVRDLSGAIDLRTIRVRSRAMIGELLTFQYKDEKAEAAPGHRDDGVISAALANYAATGNRAPPLERYLPTMPGALQRMSEDDDSKNDPYKRSLLDQLTPEERSVWKAIDDDCRYHSVINGFDPETGAALDPAEQVQLLKQMRTS